MEGQSEMAGAEEYLIDLDEAMDTSEWGLSILHDNVATFNDYRSARDHVLGGLEEIIARLGTIVDELRRAETFEDSERCYYGLITRIGRPESVRGNPAD